MASIKRPAHSTSRTRRRTRRGDGVRFPIVVSIVVLIVVALVARRRPIAYRPQGFHPGEAVILWGIYSAPFSSAHLVRPRLIVSSIPRFAVPSGRADKQAAGGRQAVGQAGGRLSPSAPSPYRFRPRLVHRVVGRGEGVSLPSAGSVSGPRFPVAGQGIVVGSTPQPSRQASKAARLGPVPPIVSAPWLILGPAVNGRNGK